MDVIIWTIAITVVTALLFIFFLGNALEDAYADRKRRKKREARAAARASRPRYTITERMVELGAPALPEGVDYFLDKDYEYEGGFYSERVGPAVYLMFKGQEYYSLIIGEAVDIPDNVVDAAKDAYTSASRAIASDELEKALTVFGESADKKDNA